MQVTQHTLLVMQWQITGREGGGDTHNSPSELWLGCCHFWISENSGPCKQSAKIPEQIAAAGTGDIPGTGISNSLVCQVSVPAALVLRQTARATPLHPKPWLTELSCKRGTNWMPKAFKWDQL